MVNDAARLILRSLRAALRAILAASLLLALLIPLIRRPQDLPWTPLRSLNDPVGAFTATKLARLREDGPGCRSLLARAGFGFERLPAMHTAPECTIPEPLRLSPRAPDPVLLPTGLPFSCSLAASLGVWERQVVQPVARAVYGARVSAIDTFGSYSCRRIYGRTSGDWSEHAHANAVDVAGFRLTDGHRVTVAASWRGTGRDARFLHLVHDGGCRIFATVLSPDYNAAHRDHLHLDQAARGDWGWRACR